MIRYGALTPRFGLVRRGVWKVSILSAESYESRQERQYRSFPVICCPLQAIHIRIRGVGMADVIFVVLTIAIFVIFGFVVKAVERL